MYYESWNVGKFLSGYETSHPKFWQYSSLLLDPMIHGLQNQVIPSAEHNNDCNICFRE
jgi:hypothetical protein